MARDVEYINGIIAAKEKFLLKDKILKWCELNAQDAFSSLVESGFGKGAEVNSLYDYEKLIAADEAAIDCFIRDLAPSAADAEYLLAPRDFHNAKALIKARYTGADPTDMLAPEGLVPVKLISDCVSEGKFEPLGGELGVAAAEAAALFSDEGNPVSGAEIGVIFEKATYAHLAKTCAKSGILKKLLAAKADMTNILTYLRSSSPEYAERCFVSGGKLTKKQLALLFSDDRDKAEKCLDGTPYAQFLKSCFKEKSAGLPLTQPERISESYEVLYFSGIRYELEKNQPFLYYVFRRRAENANVRILFACLLAGMKESDVKKRLRTYI